jgi:hypothetical protein
MFFSKKKDAPQALGIFEASTLIPAVMRKEAALQRLEYYRDAQLEYLQAQLAQKFKSPEKLQPLFINVVRKIVDMKSTTYLEPPKRDLLNATEQDMTTFNEIAAACSLSVKMKTASRLVKLLKTVMVRPVWRNGKIDLDILTPDILDVATGKSPEDVQEVMVTRYGAKQQDTTFEVISAQAIRILDYRGQLKSEEENPYGILPLVPLWDKAPLDTFFVESGEDLIVAQDALNSLLTSLVYTCEMQGYSVGYIKTASTDGTIEAGPGTMVELEKDGEVGFASPDAPIADVLKTIEFILKQTAIANGLSASSLSTEPTNESGIARIIGNLELMEQRADEIELFRGYEKRIFETIRAVWNHHNPGRKLSEGATLRVDFYDLKKANTLTEQVTAWSELLSLGIISEVDIVMEHNPDIKTREEAMRYLIMVREERGQINGDEVFTFRSNLDRLTTPDNDEQPDTEDINGTDADAA